MRIGAGLLLLSSMALGGCYVESTITRDQTPPGGEKVYFYLRDGSYVKSYADHHPRVEGGYDVQGTIIPKGGSPKEFSGMISDREIARITVDRYNFIGTAVAVFVATGLIYAILPKDVPSLGL